MKTDLLASKFYYPPHRVDFVQRPDLLENLEAGLNRKLTLVSAPAGFGKTTLVSEWIQERRHPAAWLSLDRNDNDLARFLIYLIAALQQVDPQIGIDVQAVLEESLSPHIEVLLTRLIGEIERLPSRCILVLDDYHLIDAKSIHDVINFLIEYLPPTIHLVISGRTDPPLPISRLRVQGEVNEIRTAILRFTNDEVTTFLNDMMGFNLSPDNIQALESRTEGWIASLKLAALSMQGLDDWTGFITKFSGSNRYVIDYLVDEVMARQPGEVQTFLRRTSILDRLCAPLCKYVVDGHANSDIIEHLDRSNLFLIPLDDHREWYRYHHLFADFLSQRLRETEPDIIPELHRRASQWYKNEGLMDEAILHALNAGDFENAAQLIDGIAIDMVVRRECNKLLKLIERLPYDLYQAYPMLCICHAWALLFMGQLDQVEQALAVAEVHPKYSDGAQNRGYVTTVRAFLANQEGDLVKSMNLNEQALKELSTADPDQITLIFQGSNVIWLGVNHQSLGNLEKAELLFKEAATLNQKAGNYYAALSCYEQLAELAVIRGELHQALDLYHAGLKLAENWTNQDGKPQRSFIAAAGPQLGLGTVLYQMNDLEGAAAHIQRSADLLELGELWRRIFPYIMLAYLRQAEGEFEASAELLEKVGVIEESLRVRHTYPPEQPSHTQLRILLSRARPDLEHLVTGADQWSEDLGIHATDEIDFSSPNGYPRELIYSDLACLLIAQDQPAEALPLLMRLLEAARKMGRHGDEIHYLVSIALAQHALENREAAIDSLHMALTLAQPHGYVRVFVDKGPPMEELLEYAISQNVMTDYASSLLSAFPEEVRSSAVYDQGATVNISNSDEALSEREFEVLRLIAEGYKYQEIAERLVVSINTVRHHVRNVYGKFYVNNRTQAISKAKDLNLL